MHAGLAKLTMNNAVRIFSRALNGAQGRQNMFSLARSISSSANTPMNTVIMFVPHQEAWVVERMGKFYKILEPGLNFLIPILDRVKYVQSLKEIAIDVPKQSAVTSDNVTLSIDGVLYLRINDPYLASYGVEDPEFAILQLAQTTMRSELGKISLDKVFREREELNSCIVGAINKASEAWGITSLRYEIRDIKVPQRVQDAMQMQVEAERRKRAAVLESEGIREAEINVAEGKRLARILQSEAIRQENINKASGEATALITVAEARAKELQMVANVLATSEARNAAALGVAEHYVEAFSRLAKVNNTVILPSNISDVSSFVTQAMTIYKHVVPALEPKRTQSPTDGSNPSAKILMSENEDAYEYFSDREEAEKHKLAQSETPKVP